MDYEDAYASTRTYRHALRDFASAVRRVERCIDGEFSNRSITGILLEADARPGRTMLDVGAGSGFLMGVARRHGFSVAGIDASERSRRHLAAHFPGAPVHASLDEVPGRYSYVCCLEVLEHVADPLGLLRALLERLDGDGRLIASVPNVDRFYWRSGERGGERRWWQQGGVGDTAPHHLTRFSRHGLEALLRRAGARSFSLAYTPLDAVTWGIWGLGSAPSFSLRVAGLRVRVPFLALRGYLTREIASRVYEADESLGFGLMALVTQASVSPQNLEASLRQAQAEAMRRHAAYYERDLLAILWDERRMIGSSLGARLRRLVSGRTRASRQGAPSPDA